MLFRLDDLNPAECHRLLTVSVAPRPIALVTTLAADGRVNAAPFSCFNYIGDDPPLVYLGVERYGRESHRLGERKDTAVNIARSREFVVNMTTEPLLEPTVSCGTDYPETISETSVLQLALCESATVAVPRLRDSPVALECGLYRTLALSAEREIVVGQVRAIHFDDALIDAASGRVAVERYLPMARLGGPYYCRTGDRVFLPVQPFEASRET